MLIKNHAHVRFPDILDLNDWCLGTERVGEQPEIWNTDPKLSMLSQPGAAKKDLNGLKYELRAVLTHYGRHENGHYICYRKFSTEDFPDNAPDAMDDVDSEKEAPYRWFRLSDDNVQMVSENAVLNQCGVFMLFYERVNETNEEFHDADTRLEENVPGIETVEKSLEAAVAVKSGRESSDESRPISTPGISTPGGTSGTGSDICKSDLSFHSPATPLSEASSRSAVMPDDAFSTSEEA
jgi:ubiquitin carboxyl-terminal hydrolase 1